MIENPITKNSLEYLDKLGFQILGTQTKSYFVKMLGMEQMAEPIDIFHVTCRELLKSSYWIERKVVLSGGEQLKK